MPVAQPPICPAPFDVLAEAYDQTFTSSRIGQAQRAAVWKTLGKAFRTGDRVLEIGCGTGVDACFLAEHGVRVTACDSSSRMIAIARRRIRETGFEQQVQPLLLPAEQLADLSPTEHFDGVYSNFGALNCVEDIHRLARNLATLIRPGGIALLCWMGPCCAWEMAWYLAQGKPTKAFRRLHRQGIITSVAGGTPVRVHYPSVRFLARAFAPDFRMQGFTGIGVAVPPSYLESWAQRVPRLLQFCTAADSVLGSCRGIRMLADHVLLRFERTQTRSGRS